MARRLRQHRGWWWKLHNPQELPNPSTTVPSSNHWSGLRSEAKMVLGRSLAGTESGQSTKSPPPGISETTATTCRLRSSSSGLSIPNPSLDFWNGLDNGFLSSKTSCPSNSRIIPITLQSSFVLTGAMLPYQRQKLSRAAKTVNREFGLTAPIGVCSGDLILTSKPSVVVVSMGATGEEVR
jgi:hypothetical protein